MHVDHFIWSTYGNWMPNCPRESWPRYVRTWERARTGLQMSELNAMEDRGSDPYRVNKMVAEKSRRFPPVSFTAVQMQGIAEGFERCARLRHAWIWACSILPEYVQMLVTCPCASSTLLAGAMRSEATKRLTELDLHPTSDYGDTDGHKPLMWSHVKWHQQLKDDQAIHQAIEYVQELPQREGTSSQHWNFVRQFQSLDRCREECESYELAAG